MLHQNHSSHIEGFFFILILQKALKKIKTYFSGSFYTQTTVLTLLISFYLRVLRTSTLFRAYYIRNIIFCVKKTKRILDYVANGSFWEYRKYWKTQKIEQDLPFIWDSSFYNFEQIQDRVFSLLVSV